MSLAKRHALVTGSTSGIGLAIARALAKEGADVMIKDDRGQLVARGTVNPDRVSLKGPGGERIPIMSGRGWKVVVLRGGSGPHDRPVQ